MEEWTKIIEATGKALIDIGKSLGPLIKPIHTEIEFTQLNEPKTKAKLEELLLGKLQELTWSCGVC